jgi:hypothetical protein
MARAWTLNSQTGGVPTPDVAKEETKRRLLTHAEKDYAGRYARLDIRFKGALCYVTRRPCPRRRGPFSVDGILRGRRRANDA